MAEILRSEQLNHLLSMQASYLHDNPNGADSPFVRLLSVIEREQLSRMLSERYCVPGEIVIREGEAGDAMYIVRSGRVLVWMGDIGSPTILGSRGAGEMVGEMALLENRPRVASVVALSDLHLFKLSRDDFYNLLRREPVLALNIMEVLSARLRASHQARSHSMANEQKLMQQVNELQREKQQLLETQRLRQETVDLLIHDLRNPIGSVSLAIKMLEMVMPDNLVNENQQLIKIARSGSDRMLRLIDSLLEISRMEAGETHPIPTRIDLVQVIREVIENTLAVNFLNVQLELHLPQELPLVEVDREMIERVLANLFDNALKYTPDGGKITIGAKDTSDSVQVSVADSGPGIPLTERERIFERFVRVEGGKRGRRGFGLGLAYCKLAVEAHGGRLWVEQVEEYSGSCFVFSLPYAQAGVEQPIHM